MARSKNAKQWTGVLAEPIDDIGSLMPQLYQEGSPERQEWIERRATRLHLLRMAKMPELARQLGIQVDKFDLGFFAQLALYLAR